MNKSDREWILGTMGIIGFVLIISIFYLLSVGTHECRKNAEYIQNLPTHIECIYDVHILDENHNWSRWSCDFRSNSNAVSMIPACNSMWCDGRYYSMEECVLEMCDIRVEERIS